MKFYTHCSQYGNKILYRGVHDGRAVVLKESFSPTLFVGSKKPSQWKGLYGENVEPMTFGDLNDAKEFMNQYKDVSGFDIHGMTQFQYQYINKNFPGDIEYDIDQMNIMFLDIEVVSDDNSFPDIQSASTPIVLIACHDKATNKSIAFGYKTLPNAVNKDYDYRIYKDEMTMLKEFVMYWQGQYPDIVSGWNSDQFDFPYIINRINRILDGEWVKKLSPFNLVRERMIEIRGKEVQTYDIVGITQLDYLELYKKFGTYSAKESYALGFIAEEELGDTKHESPASSFNDWYENHYESFTDYNVQDARLVYRLEDKMRLIELALSVAYMAKVNIKDVFGAVKLWDVFIYNYLSKKNIAIPPQKQKLGGDFEGAWVKEPVPGMYGWTLSFDFSALYPTIIMQWNISPETLVEDCRLPIKPDDLVYMTDDTKDQLNYAIESGYSVAANGTCYRKNARGFLPEMMELVTKGRKVAKKEMIRKEQEFESTHDESLKGVISALNNKQMALKIMGNSAYGAITNVGFRYYDLRIGEAITLTGQASDKHIEKVLNQFMNKALKTELVDYIIAADTDSVYLNVDKIAVKSTIDENVAYLDKFAEKVLQPVINKSIQELFDTTNAFDKLMDMKREAIASKAIWVAKKQYALMLHNSEGVEYKPYKLKIMGLSIIKSSTPQIIRKKLKAALPVLFEQGELELRKYVSEVKAEFDGWAVEDIAFPRSANDIDKWKDPKKIYKKGTPIHVRGSLLYNEHTKKYSHIDTIRNRDKVKFVYLVLPNPIREDVVSFPSAGTLPKELNLHKYIDKELQWEKTFLASLQGITNAIGWQLVEKSSLEDFFG